MFRSLFYERSTSVFTSHEAITGASAQKPYKARYCNPPHTKQTPHMPEKPRKKPSQRISPTKRTDTTKATNRSR